MTLRKKIPLTEMVFNVKMPGIPEEGLSEPHLFAEKTSQTFLPITFNHDLDAEFALISSFVQELLYEQEPAAAARIATFLLHEPAASSYDVLEAFVASFFSPELFAMFRYLFEPLTHPILNGCAVSRQPEYNEDMHRLGYSENATLSDKQTPPSTALNLRSSISMHENNERSLSLSDGDIESAIFLFEKVFTAMRYDNELFALFIKSLDLYMAGCFSLPEVLGVLERILPMHIPKLPYQLKEFLATREVPRRHSSLYTRPLSHLNPKICRQEGRSYLELPETIHRPWCSGRELETNDVRNQLNDDFISIPRGSEDDGFTHPKHNVFEDAMFRLEDDMFELDIVLGGAQSLIATLRPFQLKLLQWQGDLESFTLCDPPFKSIHLKALARIYGIHAEDVLDLLHRCPGRLLEPLLNHVCAKVAQWKAVQQHLISTSWKDAAERNFYKQFDHKLYYLKALDKHILATPSVMEYQALALYCIHRRLPVFDDVARKLRYVHKKVVHQTAGFSGCAPIPNPPMNYSVAPHEEKRLHDVTLALELHPGAVLNLEYEPRNIFLVTGEHQLYDIHFPFPDASPTLDAELRKDVLLLLFYAAERVVRRPDRLLSFKQLLTAFLGCPSTTIDFPGPFNNYCARQWLNEVLRFQLENKHLIPHSPTISLQQREQQNSVTESSLSCLFSISASDEDIDKVTRLTSLETQSATEDALVFVEDDENDTALSASEKQPEQADSEDALGSCGRLARINSLLLAFSEKTSVLVPLRIANGSLYCLSRLYWVLYYRLFKLHRLISCRKDPADPASRIRWAETDNDIEKRRSYRDFVDHCIIPRLQNPDMFTQDMFDDELRIATGNNGVFLSTLPFVVSSAVKFALTAMSDFASTQLVALTICYQALFTSSCAHSIREYVFLATTLLGDQTPQYWFMLASSCSHYCNVRLWTPRDYKELLHQSRPLASSSGHCASCGAAPHYWYLNPDAGVTVSQPLYYHSAEESSRSELFQVRHMQFEKRPPALHSASSLVVNVWVEPYGERASA